MRAKDIKQGFTSQLCHLKYGPKYFSEIILTVPSPLTEGGFPDCLKGLEPKKCHCALAS